MLEPLNSLDTDSYFLPIFFHFFSIGGPWSDQKSFYYGCIRNSIWMDISHIYMSLPLSLFPRDFEYWNGRYSFFFFFVLSPPFPNETRKMSHYDLDCIFSLSFP
eukprot:TRINITY_DN13258_c0_g2_i1.p1 TRINITY_DN13258_c0_g2~~TRINITY_DN13258_c0_g2_i1.p1  ORF type:complete len:104 (+),score=3.38 TRINITY_DN13258_c0_g2_i1:637-948(+)